MKILVDIDDIGNMITQAIMVDYYNKVSNLNDVFSFEESFVNFGKGIKPEYIAYAEEVLEDIMSKMSLSRDFVTAINNIFPWDCLLRAPIDDVDTEKCLFSEIARDMLDENDIVKPTKTIVIPLLMKHKPSILVEKIIDENYTLLTTSTHLAYVSYRTCKTYNLYC